MVLLHGNQVSFRFPGTADELFSALTFVVDTDTRAGLVGPNGSGKSTLLHLLRGALSPTAGALFRQPGIRIGYLPQALRVEEAPSGLDLLWRVRPDLARLRATMTAQAAGLEPDAGSVSDDFDTAGGHAFAARIDRLAASFQLSATQLQSPLDQLSGGERTKLALAALVLAEPDLLLLDEPTNHLDVATLEWLEGMLTATRLPFVVISHDRRFLDRCVETIWDLDRGSLRCFAGAYTAYRHQREHEFDRAMLEHRTQQRKIRQLQRAARERRQWAYTYQAQTGREGYAPVFESVVNWAKKAMKRAKNVERRIELMIEKEEAKKPWVEKRRRVSFSLPDGGGPRFVLRVEDLAMRFGARDVLRGIDFGLERGERLAVTGPNGCGKTTLLRLLTGHLTPTAGRVGRPPGVTVASFTQDHEHLDPKATAIDAVGGGDRARQTVIRTTLGCLGLDDARVRRPLETLSLGERAKVAIAKTILSGACLLILDEPTNHLEIAAREAIETALANFTGAIVFVSHDRAFVDRLATRRLALADP